MVYALNLDCNKLKTNGELNGYSYDSNQATSPLTNPKGQVWWQSSNGSTDWAPVAGTDPKKQGDPKHVIPVVAKGDTFWVAIRDDQNNPISEVKFAIVFGKRGATPGQAPIASPFQKSEAGATTYDRTTFTEKVISQRDGDGFYVYQLPVVSYPDGGNNKVNFGFYFGASVTYGSGTTATVREFGMDPEMDVSDYNGGSPEPAPAG